ncbi:MAG: threonine aldolase family protein [Chitinophagaceae bacterium]
MYSFKNDYSEGCHPRILETLLHSNIEQQNGYGEDAYSKKARQLILKKINNPNADIYFLSGGTQANLTIINAALRSYESVIAAHSAHIQIHETGAIENTGHKIHIAPSNQEKVTPQDIQKIIDQHTDHHMVKPRMVYISNATEIGTIYKKEELKKLYQCCKKNNLYLFIDGARLGFALCAKTNDMTLEDVAEFSDVFYIGGTKNGALLGEAIVISNNDLKVNFNYHIKQQGALLAKGRILGIQFLELFKDNLFFILASHANEMAMKLKNAFQKEGVNFFSDSPSNQIFPILPNMIIRQLSKKYDFYIWEKIDAENSVIRLITSWCTPPEKVNEFINDFYNLVSKK